MLAQTHSRALDDTPGLGTGVRQESLNSREAGVNRLPSPIFSFETFSMVSTFHRMSFPACHRTNAKRLFLPFCSDVTSNAPTISIERRAGWFSFESQPKLAIIPVDLKTKRLP
jgi:hypothetical protein